MYILPQVQVFQEFRVAPTTTVKNLNAFVFGAHYQLFRYAQASEKALIGLGSYDPANDAVFAYPEQPAGSTVDTDYVKLYMDTVWAQYAVIASASANPMVQTDSLARNKLRAAPVIAAAKNYPGATGVNITSGGYFHGEVGLPEDYYFYPVGGWTGAAWGAGGYTSDISDAVMNDAKLAYITSEGLTGTVAITGSEQPLHAGNYVTGPDGLVLDLDAGSPTSTVIRKPKTITIGSAGYAASFTITPNLAYIKDMIDWAVDLSKPLMINIDTGTGNSVSWSSANKTLTIVLDSGTPYTLNGLRAALVGDSDIATYFTVGTVSSASAVVVAKDEAAVSVLTGADVAMVPYGYRIRITPNPYVFATGNGTSNSAQFRSRGVQVGDKVRYTVTVGATPYTGETKVTGFEADKTLAVVATPTAKASNSATQVATTISAGAAIVAAGADNQRLFNGANTKVHALDSVLTAYTGDLTNGVLSDTFNVEITASGAAGTAQATVTNDSGTYYRTNVPIEIDGSYAGKIYLGRNMYIEFQKGGSEDGVFQAGDTYTFSSDVKSAFTAVGTSVLSSGGTYVGPSDTNYLLEVVRGGVFNRTVHATAGFNVPAVPATLVPTIDWTAWSGGDITDEYVLRCIAGGPIATAEFSVTSLAGDDATGIVFNALASDVAIGGRGLVAQFTSGGAPTFTVGDSWVIKVNACRPRVKIYDTAGIDQGSYVTVNDATDIDLGSYGATMQFAANTNTEGGFAANGGLVKGDVFYVAAKASADGALRTIVLADDLPSQAVTGYNDDGSTNFAPSNFGVWLYLVQNSAEITSKKLQSSGDYNWVATAGDVTVNKAIYVTDASWVDTNGDLVYIPVYKGDMYLEYRALLSEYTDTIHFISDISNVTTELGTISVDNPLAQGVFNALTNSGNRGVYFMAVPSDDLAGFSSVLDKASLTDSVYAFAPMTRDRTILAEVEAHINAMSSETVKRWRIGFFGTEMATETAVYNKAKNPAGQEFYATTEDNPAVAGTQYTLLKFTTAAGAPSPYTQVLTNVKVGDTVRISYSTDPWGDVAYETYKVASLKSNTSLVLSTGTTTAISTPTKVEVWHTYSVAELANAVAAVSSSFASRRIYHVFPGSLGAYGVVQTAEFGAAAVAGLCSSVVPQQGLTNIELLGFDDLPLVYSTFNRDQLNTMAGAGTLIIMQDVAGGSIYVRHQVSTATADGDLNTTELSLTKNLDSISYYFAARLAPYIGKYNVTPDLLVVLRTQITDGLLYLGSFTAVGLLGPQITLDGTSISYLKQHPTLKDHVISSVDLNLPAPFNVMELHLVV